MLACVAVGPLKNGNSALRRGRQPRARVDVSRFGNERTVDLKGVEHALDVRVSLVLSACALNHAHCISHLAGDCQFQVGKTSS